MPFESMLLAVATLLLLSVLASRASGHVGVPALLLLWNVCVLPGHSLREREPRLSVPYQSKMSHFITPGEALQAVILPSPPA